MRRISLIVFVSYPLNVGISGSIFSDLSTHQETLNELCTFGVVYVKEGFE
jgi:hypothetical protein